MCRTSRRTRRTRYPPIGVLGSGADAIDRSTFRARTGAIRPNRPFSRRGRSRRKIGEISRSSSSTSSLDIRAKRSADDSSAVGSPTGSELASSPDSTSRPSSRDWSASPLFASTGLRTGESRRFCGSPFDASGRDSSGSSKSSEATGLESTGPIPDQPGAPPIELRPELSHWHRHLESPISDRKPSKDQQTTHPVTPAIRNHRTTSGGNHPRSSPTRRSILTSFFPYDVWEPTDNGAPEEVGLHTRANDVRIRRLCRDDPRMGRTHHRLAPGRPQRPPGRRQET